MVNNEDRSMTPNNLALLIAASPPQRTRYAQRPAGQWPPQRAETPQLHRLSFVSS